MLPFIITLIVNEHHTMKNQPTDKKTASQFFKTDGGRTKSNAIEIPSISLPKGGGAIKGIDEKFTVNSANGTASYSIPLPFSAGRNGMNPGLSLSYNSGGGNGIFGLGWGCDSPSIQRKTEKKLPEYRDSEHSDIFIFSGAEDLVPELGKDKNGKYLVTAFSDPGSDSKITRYRPRIEGGFSRIEKIESNGNIFWRVRTKDNSVSVFGETNDAKLFNPVPGKTDEIFKWCLEYSYDDKGNFTKYIYKKENKESLASALSEKNRLNGNAPFTNIYLKKIQYGNKAAYYEGDPLPNDFLFELILDFGEHEQEKPTSSEIAKWQLRKDPFSDYRAGFEVRTYRLCKRVLMFHHFETETGLEDYLVRSMDFEYDERPHLTYLDKIIQTGYIWNTDGTLQSKHSLPPLEFTCQKPGFSRQVKELSRENLLHDPIGLDNQVYQWTDLFSEGISGILSEQANGWYYKENLGDGEFSPAKLVSPKPSFSGLSDGRLSIRELEANGEKYIVKTDATMKGYFGLTAEEEWVPFFSFQKFPNIDLKDPNLKYLDLNGDGMPDLLISREQEFIWYSAKGKTGYDDYHLAAKASEEEKGPRVLFADKDEKVMIAIADMSGDGLADIVLVGYSNVCYYPNLGYGRFGARVTLEMNGCFDTTSDFNINHLHLTDMDGSGTTDIVYTGKNKVQVWFNQSGNSLSDPLEFFNPFSEFDNHSRMSFIDLLGNGTSCMVWSSSLPSGMKTPLKYIDIMNGCKPHVMVKHINNSGKEVTIEYKTSTHFYLEDKKKGKKWITKLPFPIQCVSKVITEDKVSKTRFASEYKYHHGYYDAIEREFRGFAMVEQTDCETYETFLKETMAAGAVNIMEKDLYQPAVITKTWFHTGAFIHREEIVHQLKQEYYPGEIVRTGELQDIEIIADLEKSILSEISFPENLTAHETIECCRALKGLPLRQELYSDEGDELIKRHPYTVTQHNYEIKMLQPLASQKHAVFLSHEKESIIINYERDPLDPRIAHTINLEIDQYGNVLQSASIVYGRKKDDKRLPKDCDREKQTKQHVTYTQNHFTEVIDTLKNYRLPLPCESQTWELNTTQPSKTFFSSNEILDRFDMAVIRSYEEEIRPGEKRKIEHSATLFLKDDLTGPMDFGKIDTKGLPFENYLLAFTSGLINDLYKDKFVEDIWRNHARYVQFENDGNYWIKSGRTWFHTDLRENPYTKIITTPVASDIGFAKSNFFLPVAYEDNFGHLSKVFYDDHKLFITRSIDPLDNEIRVEAYNYRTLAPYLMKDPNENRAGIRFDELGLVTHTFVMGKENEYNGDPIDLSSVEFSANDQPSTVMEYQFSYFESGGQLPNRVKARVRENHHCKCDGTNEVETDITWQESFSYSDGSGHEVLKKIQAEPGEAPARNSSGKLLHDTTGNLIKADTTPFLRWVGNGRTIVNNKGKPVKQYEPFFDCTPEYNDECELTDLGHPTVLYYDAPGRLIKTVHNNGTFSKVEFDAWAQKSYDENDTVKKSRWYAERINGENEAEKEAARKAELHFDTPAETHLDSLGRPFISVEHNKLKRTGEEVNEESYHTRAELDIEGNTRSGQDQRGNTVMSWKYDMLGNICFQQSMDAGDRWMLNDVMGKQFLVWDSRGQMFRHDYDELDRPLFISVNQGSGDITYEKYEYGENAADAKTNNLRGKLFKHYDTAGLITNETYDFKGNLLKSSRQLLKDYKNIPDWQTSSILEEGSFSTETVYDAMNRPVTMATPDTSIFYNRYNAANLLESVEVKIKGAENATCFVSNINYNAKGQREAIYYGNNTKTRYYYDPQTDHLIRLLTTAGNGTRILQDLKYTYDPVGNITQIFDNAQKTIFYGGQEVEAQSDYIYDAIYRLVEASGREHRGQIGRPGTDNFDDAWCRLSMQPNSPVQMRNYTQKYFYDGVGNIEWMVHEAGSEGSRTREYTYETGNNRLIKTTIGEQDYLYTYNEHGSMITMPHLPVMDWNFRDEIQHLSLGGGGDAWYVYDHSGQRTRKVIERPGNKTEERIYLGAFEIYRERTGTDITLERETLHVMDDKQRIAMVETKTTGNDTSPSQLIRYQYSNHLGSACLELDKDAKIISYEEYHPYGTTAYSATDASREVPKKRYRYTGIERDEESGLNYHSARYYAPWLGRWVSCDPDSINCVQSRHRMLEQFCNWNNNLNFYQYVRNRPISMIDLDGKQENDVDKRRSLLIKTAERHRVKYGNDPGGEDPIEETPGAQFKYWKVAYEIWTKTRKLSKTEQVQREKAAKEEIHNIDTELKRIKSEDPYSEVIDRLEMSKIELSGYNRTGPSFLHDYGSEKSESILRMWQRINIKGLGNKWCGAFVASVYAEAGLLDPVKDFKLIRAMLAGKKLAEFLRENKSYMVTPKEGSTITPEDLQPGDLVAYPGGHVGMVHHIQDGIAYFIEGNYWKNKPIGGVYIRERSEEKTVNGLKIKVSDLPKNAVYGRIPQLRD